MTRCQAPVNGDLATTDIDLTPTEEQAPTPEPAQETTGGDSEEQSDDSSEEIIVATQHIKVSVRREESAVSL